jgi:hypothetical protein
VVGRSFRRSRERHRERARGRSRTGSRPLRTLRRDQTACVCRSSRQGLVPAPDQLEGPPALPPAQNHASSGRLPPQAIPHEKAHPHRLRRARARAARDSLSRASAADHAGELRARDRDPARLASSLPLQGLAVLDDLRRRRRDAAVPDAPRQLLDRQQAAKPLVVSAERGVGGRREPDPARPRQPARHALGEEWAFTGRPIRPRSGTRPRTGASACASRKPNGSSSASTSARPFSSSRPS